MPLGWQGTGKTRPTNIPADYTKFVDANGLRGAFATTKGLIVEQANTIYAALYDQDYPLDLSIQQALANDPAALTDSLNVLLLNGNMSGDMRMVIIDTVSQIPATDINERVQSAVYLVLTSAEYVIEK